MVASLVKPAKPAAFYRIGVFALEPLEYGPAVGGAVRAVSPEGCLEWYAEGLPLGKPPYPVTVLVTYQRIEPRDDTGSPLAGPEDERAAIDLAELLVLPSVLQSGHPVHPRLLAVIFYDCRRQSAVTNRGMVTRIWTQPGACLGGPPAAFGVNYKTLLHDEGLRRAARYFSLGLRDAEEQHLSDACLNYVKALECLLGSWRKAKDFIKSECARIGADLDGVRWLMDKARGEYSLAHVLDHVGPTRKFKKEASPDVEERARSVCRETLASYWAAMPAPDADERRGDAGHSWPLSPPLPLPTPLDAVELAGGSLVATSLIPQLTTHRPVSEVAKKYGVSPSWVRRLCASGRVKAVRTGPIFLVDLPSLEAWLLSQSPKRQAQAVPSIWYIGLPAASQTYGLGVPDLRRLIADGTLQGYTLSDETERVSVAAISEYVAAKERRRQRRGRPPRRASEYPLRW